jgi:hypothetical protein
MHQKGQHKQTSAIRAEQIRDDDKPRLKSRYAVITPRAECGELLGPIRRDAASNGRRI